jgi:AraC-like DNA-binding protein
MVVARKCVVVLSALLVGSVTWAGQAGQKQDLPADLRVSAAAGGYYEIHPGTADSEEEFERLANALKPGDELVLHGGEYSQDGRRVVTVNGTAEAPIVIRAAEGQSPLLTRPAEQIDRYNNIEFVDCSYLVIRGLRFRGGSSGVRFIRGHHITFEDCEVFETGNNALTMNSGSCDSFIIRRNHFHHTGLSTTRPTEGEGMYIGCHDGSCITTNTLVEGILLDPSLSSSLRTVELFLAELRDNPERLAQSWTLRTMAEHCGLAETRFRHYCRQLTNMTPVQFLERYRVEAASRMLVEKPRMTVTEVAMACGFGSSQYFATLFRRHHGRSPRTFRERAHINEVCSKSRTDGMR